MRAHVFLLTFWCAVAGAFGATHTVHIYDYYFTPTNISVNAGDTVTWINEANTGHDTTQYDQQSQTGFLWMSPVLARGETFSFTFNDVGFYPYVCATHFFTNPEQTGTVSVVVANVAPTVNITSPQNGASFSAPASFQITADPRDSDGTIASVEFFVNGASQGSATPPNFSANVSGLEVGNYTLTAVATDNAGAPGSSPPISISVTQANVVLPKYPLTISLSPSGAGTVTAEPLQPDGGYESNTVVTLTASANSGFAFANWSGDASGTGNPITVTMNGARSATANFSPLVTPTRTLTLATNPAGGGVIQVSPAPNGPNGTYLDETRITLTASGAFGFSFSNWSGSVSATTNPLVITLSADQTVTANFISTPVTTYALTLVTNPVGAGTIGVSPAPNAPGGAYIAGTVVTLTATALTTNAFTNWTGDVSSTSNRVTLTIDGNKTATANFVPIIPPSYTLTISVTPTNSGAVLLNPRPRTNGTYASGTVVAVAAVPERNFRFVGWTGSVTSTNNPLLVTMTANTSLTAHFEALPQIDFLAESGLYVGLLMEDTNVALATSGAFSLHVDKSGSFDGVANIGGKKQAIGGQFDRFGYAPLALRRGTLSGSLQITADRISGELTDGGRSPKVLLHAVTNNAAPLSGVYRLTIPPNDFVSQSSTMTLTILASGVAQLRGRLGDGVAFTHRTKLTDNGRVPVFASLYSGRGGLLGWIDFLGEGAIGGTLRWIRPPDSRSQSFPDGFLIETTVTNGAAE
jgi:plastocyanin